MNACKNPQRTMKATTKPAPQTSPPPTLPSLALLSVQMARHNFCFSTCSGYDCQVGNGPVGGWGYGRQLLAVYNWANSLYTQCAAYIVCDELTVKNISKKYKKHQFSGMKYTVKTLYIRKTSKFKENTANYISLKYIKIEGIRV